MHAQGVVKAIDDNSRQLAEALVDGTKIVITTLQKFPFVLRGLLHITGAENPDDPDSASVERAKEWEEKIAARNYAVLIDDFEDSGTTMKIGRFLQNSDIYTNKATNAGATANYQVIPGRPGSGNALQGILIRQGAWALVGFYLGVKPDGDSVWDFSSATGLSFYAKGTGTLNVSVESDTLDNLGFVKHYSADVTLPAQWRHIFISFDSLTFKEDLNPNTELPWKETARSIKRIEFYAFEGDTVQFRLDDVMVNGVDFSTIY